MRFPNHWQWSHILGLSALFVLINEGTDFQDLPFHCQQFRTSTDQMNGVLSWLPKRTVCVLEHSSCAQSQGPVFKRPWPMVRFALRLSADPACLHRLCTPMWNNLHTRRWQVSTSRYTRVRHHSFSSACGLPPKVSISDSVVQQRTCGQRTLQDPKFESQHF